MFEGVVEKIRAAGGEVFAISSEPQYLADRAHHDWAIDFDHVGDPHQEIPAACSARGWLTLYANEGDLGFLQRGADWTIEHPKGFFQPGVLALTRDGRVLYRWRSVPSADNLLGTAARPTARHVWAQIDRSLARGDDAVDAAHDDHPEIGGKGPHRLLFFTALIANGWFVRAKSFVHNPGTKSVSRRFASVYARWIPFLFFWIGAFSVLPKIWVGLTFGFWLSWVAYDLWRTIRRFDVRVELSDEP